MIVINRHWLHLIGMREIDEIHLDQPDGLMLVSASSLRLHLNDKDAIGTLLLVGVNNRHGLARQCTAIIETCITGDTVRAPLQSEARTIFDALESVHHPTARAIEAALLRHLRDRKESP